MDPEFKNLVESLEPKYRTLVGMAPVKYGALPREIPIRGIYLFSEENNHLYCANDSAVTAYRALATSRPRSPSGWPGKQLVG